MSLQIQSKEMLVPFLNCNPQIVALRRNESITPEQLQLLSNGQIVIASERNDSPALLVVWQPLFSGFKVLTLVDDIKLQNELIENNIPIGKPILLCEDQQILGSRFYVKEQKQGRIFTEQSLRRFSTNERGLVYKEIISVLAHLHSCNFLKTFPVQNQFNYQETVQSIQIQYKNHETKIQTNIEDLLYWLPLNIPTASVDSTICLGQLRLENFVFHPTEMKIIDIKNLDMAHVGNPLMELAEFLANYDVPFIPGVSDYGLNKIYTLLSLPSKTELINQYCMSRQLEPIKNLSYNIVIVLLKRTIQLQVAIKVDNKKNQPFIESLQRELEVLTKSAWELVMDLTSEDPFQIKLRSETDAYLWSKYPVSLRCKSYYYRIRDFMREEVFPVEKSQFDLIYFRDESTHWKGLPGIEQLQSRAKSMGFWNLFINDPMYGKGLTNLEYTFLSELMGMSFFGHEIFNCYAPETGNIKLLINDGNEYQKQKYLLPLLEGSCKTFFTMSERNVASSDPTNFQTTIFKQGDGYVIKGSKWMVSGIQDERCKFGIIMGKTKQDTKSPFTEQSMFLVDYPNPNIIVKKTQTIIGFDEAPHGVCEVEFNNVYIPKENLLGKEGSAFANAQGRLLGGRLHHSVRLLGLTRRCIDVLMERASRRTHRGKKQKEDTSFSEKLGRMETDYLICKIMVLNAAMLLDTLGGRHMQSLKAVSETKAFVPYKCQCIVDDCIQLFGAEGATNDQILLISYIACRGIRLMDGPCELHKKQVARFTQGNHLFNELVECDGYIAAKL